jgi:hypothetical protein
MRSLWRTATVAAAALVLSGCPYHKQQPVPGPQSDAGGSALGRLTHGVHRAHAPDPINWFQGTLDEAFSGRACAADVRQLHH